MKQRMRVADLPLKGGSKKIFMKKTWRHNRDARGLSEFSTWNQVRVNSRWTGRSYS